MRNYFLLRFGISDKCTFNDKDIRKMDKLIESYTNIDIVTKEDATKEKEEWEEDGEEGKKIVWAKYYQIGNYSLKRLDEIRDDLIKKRDIENFGYERWSDRRVTLDELAKRGWEVMKYSKKK